MPRQYWEELVEIHASEIYIRLWRNQLSSRLLWIKVVRAIAASGGVAGWAIWKGYPTFWGCIIAGAQLADVAVQALPLSQNYEGAVGLYGALVSLRIDAQDEWEHIYAGKLTDDDIKARCTKLKKARVDAEHRHFKNGFTISQELFARATAEAEKANPI